jgi:hypothetical protein
MAMKGIENMPDTTPLTWFFAIVGSGTVNALFGFFIQRFLIKPLDQRLDKLTDALQKFNNNSQKRKP